MSYANGTPFINLPQTVGTDKRDWFDTNEAFLDLDAKIKSAYEGSIDTAAALAALTEVVSGISSDVSDLQTTVGNHTTSIATINEALTLINTALTSLNTTVNGKFDSAGIADPYDAEHGIYAISDVVTYNGQRYICHTAVTAAEPFDADKWTAVDIQTELDKITGDLTKAAVDITADGVKTFAALITEVATALSASGKTLTPRAVLKFRNNVYQLAMNPNNNNFIYTQLTNNSIAFEQMSLVNHSYIQTSIASDGTVTITDSSANVPTSGSHFTIFI